MGVATEFHPEVIDADDFAEAFGPEEVGAAFVKGDDVLVVDLGEDPFFLAPDAGAVGPHGGFVAVFEEFHPALGIASGELLEVVLDFEEGVALAALVDDLIEGVGSPAIGVDALEGGLV